ncbi:unnamed protein product [Phaedon cochleariae]|uniref:Uncharacterized protein n=1 Tax=Phaedon cochleariae TaxID=80249 RepID=A0A9P0DGI9_PHACE|nr:unnamed protein product [Phaedon cochleariae]
MKLLFNFLFLITFLAVIISAETHHKKKNDNTEKYGYRNKNDDSDEITEFKKSSGKNAEARKNKNVAIKGSHENDDSEEENSKYSKKSKAQHHRVEENIKDVKFDRNLPIKTAKKSMKNEPADSAEGIKEDFFKYKKKPLGKKNSQDSSEEVPDEDDLPTAMKSKHENIKKNLKYIKRKQDDSNPEENVDTKKVTKNKPNKKHVSSEEDDNKQKKTHIKKTSLEGVKKRTDKIILNHDNDNDEDDSSKNKKKSKILRRDDRTEEIEIDDTAEEMNDSEEGTSRDKVDSRGIDNSAKKCYRSKKKDTEYDKDRENVNGESVRDDSEYYKKKSKFGIKYAHEKKKDFPTRDDNLVKKIHGIEKKNQRYSDDDEDDSDEDAYPKRLHLLLDDDDD